MVEATALQKCAFEFATELPCWKNDKFEQYDVVYYVQGLDPRVCRGKYMKTHVQSFNQYLSNHKVPTT